MGIQHGDRVGQGRAHQHQGHEQTSQRTKRKKHAECAGGGELQCTGAVH